MLAEMASLGFEHVELSHGIRITLVPGILRAVEAGVVQISSTHNFCPLPTGVSRAAPNFYEPSSRDDQERDQWLRHTKRSIDFAVQVRARVVVCHLGSVRFPWLNPTRKVYGYLEAHAGDSTASAQPHYRALLEKCLGKLRKRMPPYWARVRTGVDQALEYARQKGVRLAFENRERLEELPLDADCVEFFSGLPPDAPAGYWHDAGHAEIKERIGVLDHQSHLESLAARVLGFHLHDVDESGRDHRPIGSGRVDFAMLSRFWRPEHLLTIELGPRTTADEVVASRQCIATLL